MLFQFASILLGAATLTSALPVVGKRTVTSLNEASFEEAQQRDATATRAFSSIEIKTSSGQCLFVDELSGDFRANLTPVQVVNCNGSAGQLWDVITAGVHNNVPGEMLVVSTLTQACLNFDPRRAAGNQVLLFSCGGRADGQGTVTTAQQFAFSGGAGPLAFSPLNQNGTCLFVNGDVLDQTTCISGDPAQSFTFGTGTASTSSSAVAGIKTKKAKHHHHRHSSTSLSSASVATPTVASTIAAVVSTSLAATTPAPPANTVPASGTSVIAVSGARGTLDPSAVAEANPIDTTAVKAFSAVPIKDSKGLCLFVNPTAGDFRENLIQPTLQTCTGSANELWDVITSGKHNDAANSTLFVSTVTEGCLNFDPRRATGDTVIMFSCGGRADGGGTVTNSQLFTFIGDGTTTLALQPENAIGTCLVDNNGILDEAPCTGGADQLFTIG